jgi:hypothetical protein
MKTEYESVKDGDEQAAFEAVKAVRVIKGTRRVSRRSTHALNRHYSQPSCGEMPELPAAS